MPSRALLALATVVAAACLAGLWWLTSHGPDPDAPRAAPTPADAPPANREVGFSTADSTPATPSHEREASSRTRIAGEAPPGAETRKVRGTVVLPPDTPLDEEAWVVAKSGTAAGDGRALVQPDGSFELAFPASARSTRLDLEGRYLFMGAVSLDLTDPDAPAPVLEPTLGGRIAGRVLAPAGLLDAPSRLADAEVRLVGQPLAVTLGSLQGFPLRLDAALDSELEFAFDALRVEATYTAACDPGFLPEASLSDLRIQPGETLAIDLRLQDAVGLAGTVVDASGAPIAEAVVKSRRSSRGVRVRERSQRTSEDGRFELVGVAVGPLQLAVEHEHYLPAELDLGTLRPGDDRDGLTIVLESGRAIAGTVTWPDERPVEGAWVSLFCVDDLDEDGVDPFAFDLMIGGDTTRQRTDEEGRFVFAGLEGRAYALSSWAEPDAELLGLDPADRIGLRRLNPPPWRGRVPTVQVGNQDLEVVLREGVVLTGTVTDDLGEPVARFYVTAKRVPAPGASDPSADEVRWGFRAEAGRFRLTGLRPGTWDVLASASRYPPSSAQRLVLDDSGADVSISLLRPASLAGIVVDASGAPVADALLECAPLVEMGEDLGMRSLSRTDDDGRFEVGRVDPRGVRVVASLDERSPSKPLDLELAPGEQRTGLRLVLRPGATLTGVLLEADGRPSPQRSVSIQCRAVDFRTNATTDRSGEFSVSGLPPGTYDLRTRPGSAAGDLRGPDGETDWKKYRAAAPSATVLVPDSGTVHVVLGGPKLEVRVFGAVTLDGEPLPDAQILFHAAKVGGGHTSRTRSDADGRFAIEDAREGSYVVTVLGARGQFRVQVDVPAAREHEVSIDLHSARIEGRVVDAGGSPVADARVGAARPDDPSSARSHRARSRQDGTFSLVVEPGTYDLIVGGPLLGGEWRGTTAPRVEVPFEGAAGGLEVRAERAGSLEVTLYAGTQRLDSGAVRAIGADGELLHSVRIWSPDGEDAVALFEGLPAGRLLLAGECEELASPRLVPVDVRAGERLFLELQLEPSIALEIEVVDAAGKVVPGPVLHVHDAEGLQRFASDRESSGLRFSASLTVQLPPGSYRVDASSDGRTASETVTLAGEHRRTLRIELP